MSTQQEVLSHIRLQVNSQAADLGDCWAEGYESAQSNLTEKDNPYEVSTTEYQNWTEGWWAGFYEEEPIFGLNNNVAQLSTAAPVEAANESTWLSDRVRCWTGRVVKTAGVILASIAIIELADLAA